MRWRSREDTVIQPDPRYVETPQRGFRREGPLTRFLGGSPLGVALRLAFLSVLVGALMVWLDIRPQDVFLNARRFVERFWSMGFDAIRLAGQYLLVGAVIVVPVFLIARLLSARRPR